MTSTPSSDSAASDASATDPTANNATSADSALLDGAAVNAEPAKGSAADSTAATVPTNLPMATEQAKGAAIAAMAAGYNRIQVEMAIPEIKHQPIAEQFLEIFEGQRLKVFFPDAGAAALARRDWNNPAFTVRGLGEMAQPVEAEDECYLVVNPSSIEVAAVEALCDEAGDRPVILLNPRLEDVAVVGIGYAARQLRDRFLSQLECVYYVRSLEEAALYRCYPGPWQVWRETAPDTYSWVSDFAQRPASEDIDRLLYGDGEAVGGERSPDSGDSATGPGRKRGLFSELQQFIRALTQ
jgi:hypothetical protein